MTKHAETEHAPAHPDRPVTYGHKKAETPPPVERDFKKEALAKATPATLRQRLTMLRMKRLEECSELELEEELKSRGEKVD